jgi:hypothetical protein
MPSRWRQLKELPPVLNASWLPAFDPLLTLAVPPWVAVMQRKQPLAAN